MSASENFRAYLAQSLETKSRMNAGQVRAVMGRYDKAVSVGSPAQQVFYELMEAYGNEDTKKAVASVAGNIRRALEQANKQRIDTNPVTRIRDYIARFKQNIGKLDIELGEVNEITLAQHQREGVKQAREERRTAANPVMPTLAFTPEWHLARPFYYTAIANYHRKAFPVDVEWTL